MPGLMYLLKSETIAVQAFPNGTKTVVMLRAGSLVATDAKVDGRQPCPSNMMIQVWWGGIAVEMFLVDLIERGDRVAANSVPA